MLNKEQRHELYGKVVLAAYKVVEHSTSQRLNGAEKFSLDFDNADLVNLRSKVFEVLHDAALFLEDCNKRGIK